MLQMVEFLSCEGLTGKQILRQAAGQKTQVMRNSQAGRNKFRKQQGSERQEWQASCGNKDNLVSDWANQAGI